MIWKPFVLSLSKHAAASFVKRRGFVSNFAALHFDELSANGSLWIAQNSKSKEVLSIII